MKHSIKPRAAHDHPRANRTRRTARVLPAQTDGRVQAAVEAARENEMKIGLDLVRKALEEYYDKAGDATPAPWEDGACKDGPDAPVHCCVTAFRGDAEEIIAEWAGDSPQDSMDAGFVSASRTLGPAISKLALALLLYYKNTPDISLRFDRTVKGAIAEFLEEIA